MYKRALGRKYSVLRVTKVCLPAVTQYKQVFGLPRCLRSARRNRRNLRGEFGGTSAHFVSILAVVDAAYVFAIQFIFDFIFDVHTCFCNSQSFEFLSMSGLPNNADLSILLSRSPKNEWEGDLLVRAVGLGAQALNASDPSRSIPSGRGLSPHENEHKG